MKKVWIIIIILAVVGVSIWRINAVIKTRKLASQTTEKPPVPVEVEIVKRGTIQEELSFVGNIVADSEVNVFAKVPGEIKQMLVEEGSKVDKGSVMAKIEDKELTLRVRQAEVALETTRTGLIQTKALAEIRMRSQVAQARAAFAGADAALKQVRDIAKTRVSSQLEQAEAGLTALKANLKKIKDGARAEEKKQIEATVLQAKANMENAQADLDRVEKLYSEGVVSKQTLDGATLRNTVAKSQYEAASQQMKLVETGARAEDILAVESQVKQAEAGMALVRSASESKSWEQDIEMAQSHYDQAKAMLDSAKALENAKSWEAEISAAEAGVKQAETALELAKEALSYATITAPISGVVSRRNLDRGSMASPTFPLFTIVNMNNVKAVVEAPEANLSKLSYNTKAFVSLAGLSEPVVGQITLISPTVNPVNRTASIEISIDNSSNKLRPGTFARVNIPLETHNDTALVSHSAVMDDKESGSSGKKYLFVVDSDKAMKREVIIGIAKSDILEILSGVQPGEKVIISGQNLVENGGPVKVTN